MSLLKTAAELFVSQLGTKGAGLNLNTVISALQALLPTQGGDLDVASLVGKFAAQGAGGAPNVQQILAALGKPKVDSFASQVGVDANTAASGLASVLPQLLSKGGSKDVLGSLASSAIKGGLGKLF